MTPPNMWIPILLAITLASAALIIALTGRGRRRRDREPQEMLSRHLPELDRISRRLDELRKVFLTPHIRGGVGETLLEELIRNWLPAESYSFQYGFRNGSRADAVIRLGNYLVAVDSKFPLESVQGIFGGEETEESGEEGNGKSDAGGVSEAGRNGTSGGEGNRKG